MRIEKERMYINWFLEPLESELDKRYTEYQYGKIYSLDQYKEIIDNSALCTQEDMKISYYCKTSNL